MRVTLWKPGLFIINRAENKRLKTVGILSILFCIFEYFVFSTVYIQNLFSGVHPWKLCQTAPSRDWKRRRINWPIRSQRYKLYYEYACCKSNFVTQDGNGRSWIIHLLNCCTTKKVHATICAEFTCSSTLEQSFLSTSLTTIRVIIQIIPQNPSVLS